MSLTIRYLNLSDDDISYIKEALGRYEAYFYRVREAFTINARGDMSDMLAILKVTSRYHHQSLMLRQ